MASALQTFQWGWMEQWIKEGKQALRWTRLSCRAFRDNAVRLQLFALAYNLANFLRSLVLPDQVAQWSLTTLRERLVKIGAFGASAPKHAPQPLRRVPAGRGGGAASLVRRDLAPDRALARITHGGGLTGADHGAAGAEGELCARIHCRHQSSPDSPAGWGPAALLARDPRPD
jgi:DDE family transposase